MRFRACNEPRIERWWKCDSASRRARRLNDASELSSRKRMLLHVAACLLAIVIPGTGLEANIVGLSVANPGI
jgi:hypothetical protein